MNALNRYLAGASVCALVFSSPAFGQQKTAATPVRMSVSFLINQFNSTNDSTRARAFYGLLRASHAPIPFDADQATRRLLQDFPDQAPSVRTALIGLLSTENRRVFSSNTPQLEEWTGTYHGDLINSVASLRDPRAVDVLFDAMSTGNMATGGLASLGEVALPRLHSALRSPRWEVRRDAAIALGQLAVKRSELGLRTESTNQIRNDLIGLTSDAEPFVRQHAAHSLLSYQDDEVRTAITRLAGDVSDCAIRLGRKTCPAKDAAQEWLNANPRSR